MNDGVIFRVALTAAIGGAAVLTWVGVALVMRTMHKDYQRLVAKTSDFVVLMFLVVLALWFTVATVAIATMQGVY